MKVSRLFPAASQQQFGVRMYKLHYTYSTMPWQLLFEYDEQ